MAKKKRIELKTILIAVVCVAVLAGCVGIAVHTAKSRKYDTVSSGTDSSADEQTSSGGETASSDGISLNLTDTPPDGLDAYRFVKQIYELNTLFAVESFSSPADIPVSRLVQYAFCYLYTSDSCLVDTKASSMLYRSTPESALRSQITLLFGTCPDNLKESDLYNSASGIFEMWQPDYSAQVYASATVSKAADNEWRLVVTYYNDSLKKNAADTKTAIVKNNGNEYYLASVV